jgi:hypothetical protein
MNFIMTHAMIIFLVIVLLFVCVFGYFFLMIVHSPYQCEACGDIFYSKSAHSQHSCPQRRSAAENFRRRIGTDKVYFLNVSVGTGFNRL